MYSVYQYHKENRTRVADTVHYEGWKCKWIEGRTMENNDEIIKKEDNGDVCLYYWI